MNPLLKSESSLILSMVLTISIFIFEIYYLCDVEA